jgi:hypothetical protein
MPNPDGTPTYYEVLTSAVADVTENGYDSEERVAYWAEQIRLAAERSMKSMSEIESMVREAMYAVYRKQVEMGGVLKYNPGVTPYRLEQIKPELRAELDRRIAASVNLIRVNRPQAIDKTMQRFRGWATSVPKGGSRTVKRREEKTNLRKALAQLPFEERRVIIDQNAKLFSAINTVVATNGGAIGGYWQSHKFQRNYNGRPDHNAREGKFFLVRDSWAHKAGLVKPNKDGYTDEIEQPSELPFCKCAYQYVFSLRSVPAECLTDRGKKALEEARAKIRGVSA